MQYLYPYITKSRFSANRSIRLTQAQLDAIQEIRNINFPNANESEIIRALIDFALDSIKGRS